MHSCFLLALSRWFDATDHLQPNSFFSPILQISTRFFPYSLSHYPTFHVSTSHGSSPTASFHSYIIQPSKPPDSETVTRCINHPIQLTYHIISTTITPPPFSPSSYPILSPHKNHTSLPYSIIAQAHHSKFKASNALNASINPYLNGKPKNPKQETSQSTLHRTRNGQRLKHRTLKSPVAKAGHHIHIYERCHSDGRLVEYPFSLFPEVRWSSLAYWMLDGSTDDAHGYSVGKVGVGPVLGAVYRRSDIEVVLRLMFIMFSRGVWM